jgi:hypothetical protein
MIEITVTLSFSNTHTIYIKKSKFSKKLKNDFFLPNFKNFKNFILCNKTITTLELDKYIHIMYVQLFVSCRVSWKSRITTRREVYFVYIIRLSNIFMIKHKKNHVSFIEFII